MTVVAVDAVWYRSRLPWDVTALGLMALGSLGLAPPRLSGRRFAVPYGLLFVGLLLPVRFWALCTLFGNRWGTRLLAGQRVNLSSCLRALRSAISPPFSL